MTVLLLWYCSIRVPPGYRTPGTIDDGVWLMSEPFLLAASSTTTVRPRVYFFVCAGFAPPSALTCQPSILFWYVFFPGGYYCCCTLSGCQRCDVKVYIGGYTRATDTHRSWRPRRMRVVAKLWALNCHVLYVRMYTAYIYCRATNTLLVLYCLYVGVVCSRSERLIGLCVFFALLFLHHFRACYLWCIFFFFLVGWVFGLLWQSLVCSAPEFDFGWLLFIITTVLAVVFDSNKNKKWVHFIFFVFFTIFQACSTGRWG